MMNSVITQGQMAWASIINAGESLRAPNTCSICKDKLEKIATAPLKGGYTRYACRWCQQRYNVIVLEGRDTPDESHPEFGAF